MWISPPDEDRELFSRLAQCLHGNSERCVKEFFAGAFAMLMKLVVDERLSLVAVRHVHKIKQLEAFRDAGLST